MMTQGFGGEGGGGSMNCQECGNQAKKDCAYRRCRTCCKSRGFDCPTHVRSTWVPAARRNERLSALQPPQHHHQEQQQQQHGQPQFQSENPKRQREYQQGLDMGQYPPELNSPAMFHGVRVTGMEDIDEAYGYQTAINIGGYVFKGILYDQGPNPQTGGGESSSGGAAAAHAPQFDPITAATDVGSVDPGYIDPSVYPTFMGGSQFFPPPRP